MEKDERGHALTNEDLEFIHLVKEVANHPRAQKMKDYIQHSDVSTYDHCMKVARESFRFVRKHRMKVDEKALVIGAFLHDYYLYDWHTYGDHLHGYHHAERALKNALRDFAIGEKEAGIIHTHMWPLNLTRVPGSKEAFVVCMVDKVISAKETVSRTKKQVKSKLAHTEKS